MDFRVLGPVRATDGDDELAVGGLKQRTVLAMLIAHAPNPVSVETLIAAVYGPDATTRTRRTIQTYVSTLRKALGDVVTKDGDGWALGVDGAAIDAARFEAEQEVSLGLDPADRRDRLVNALDLWRGTPYADVEAHGALDAEIARLTQLHHAVVAARIDADLQLGRHDTILGELDALVAEHPYQERFRGQHMLALYRAGRPRDALASYQQLRTLLVEELGTDPSPELQALEHQILTQTVDQPASPQPDAAPTSQPATGSQLPVAATDLIGRDDEVTAIKDLLTERRLVTITGPGGMGKSSVALEVARQIAEQGDVAVHVVQLGSVETGGRVAPAIAEALRLGSSGQDARDQVVDYLADKDDLLVLDECEHLIDTCAALAAELLKRSNAARMLATSRMRLGVTGEQSYPLPPLTDGDATIALFTSRVVELDPNFELSTEDGYLVHQLCERLDGLPLAIELAAARTSVMSLDDMLNSLDDRLRLLGSGRRGQGRSLEATLDWSYDLLDDDEQTTLARLGVIAGEFDAATAAAVADLDTLDTVDVLDALVANSLMESRTTSRGMRFRLLESIRDYASAQLDDRGDRDTTVDRHLDHWVERVSDLRGTDWVASASDIDAAIDRAVEGGRWKDAAWLLTAGEPRWGYLYVGQPHIERLAHIRANLPPDEILRERLLIVDLGLAVAQRDFRRLPHVVEQMLRSPDDLVRAYGLYSEANTLAVTDPQRALAFAEAFEATTHGQTTDFSKGLRGYIKLAEGDPSAALELLHPVAYHQDMLADAWAITALILLGRNAEAIALADDHPMRDRSWRVFTVAGALARLADGRADEARILLIEAARDAALGRVPFEANAVLIGLAALAHHDGDQSRAVEFLTAASDQRLTALYFLAEHVADQVGAPTGLIRRPFELEPHVEALEFLREVLAEWPD